MPMEEQTGFLQARYHGMMNQRNSWRNAPVAGSAWRPVPARIVLSILTTVLIWHKSARVVPCAPRCVRIFAFRCGDESLQGGDQPTFETGLNMENQPNRQIRELVKGNEAVVKGAISKGRRHIFASP